MDLESILKHRDELVAEVLKAKKDGQKSSLELRRRASKAATLEGLIAHNLFLADKRESAVESLASQGECLAFARRPYEAFRVYDKARAWASSHRLKKELLERQRALGVAPPPRSVFQSAKVDIVNNKSLRRPQREAYQAAREHFQSSQEAALIQLPVGCGKTGTMSLLPFALAQGRVLVVAPNVEIRKSLAQNFDNSHPDCFWRRANVLKAGRAPTSAVLDENANISDCDQADIIVTNIQQLMAADAEKWLWQMSPDYFDMILVDEGHHIAADSWQQSLEHFEQAKVISFTATPMRSDGKEIDGKRIYRFAISEAIAEGYVKDIATWRLEPIELSFRYKGSDEHYGLHEIVKLRESDWFSKGIALAAECNRHIVEASIQCMKELRAGSKFPHKIIAVACTIDHARALRALYEERHCRAAVLHSHMPAKAQEKVRAGLKRHELDVVVQVQMLGEGADYPSLSVAAVFRPFRHLVPYMQFIGRIMRVLRQNKPGHPDNRGYVVSHVGLNVDRWWDDLKSFDEDDGGSFFAKMGKGLLEFQNQKKEQIPDRRYYQPEMEVLEETIEHLVENRLIPKDTEALTSEVVKLLESKGLDLAGLGLSRDLIAEQLELRRGDAGKVEAPSPMTVQPQKARQQARRRLNERVRSAGKQLLNHLRVPVKGKELLGLFPDTKASSNLALAIILLNREVKELLGVASKERRELSEQELKKAYNAIDELIDRAAAKVEALQR